MFKVYVCMLEWIKDTSQFNEDIIKKYNDKSYKGNFLKVDVQYTKKLHGLHNDFPFLQKEWKLKKLKKLAANLHDRTVYVNTHKKFKTSIKSWISF